MRRAEQLLIDSGGSVSQLMQRAGEGAAQLIWRASARLPTLVVCGPGNNGGDGYVIARWLHERGVEVKVAAAVEPVGAAAQSARAFWPGEVLPLSEAQQMPQLVDCLFGTGLSRAIAPPLLLPFQKLLDGVRRKIAVDMPSGIDADNGQLLNDVAQYDLTIGLGAYKPGHFLQPARALMGRLVGVDIGIDATSGLKVIERPQIIPPADNAHKYTRGMVAIVAGEMSGAASLAALAAQHSGAGYVKLFRPSGQNSCSPAASIVSQSYKDAADLQAKLSDPRIAAIVIGPGLGRSEFARSVLEKVLLIEKPLLLDADALMLMGQDFATVVAGRAAITVATPHGGEFQVIGSATEKSKVEQCRALARCAESTVLFKGSDTVIASAEGRAQVAASSSSWLSAAGTGDVLAGIIGARLAAGNDGFTAACQGQWLHSRAAQLAGAAFTAEILIDQIAKALQECL